METPPRITIESTLNSAYKIDQFNQVSVFYYVLVTCMLCPNIEIIENFITKLNEYASAKYSINLIQKYGFPNDWINIIRNFSGYFIDTLITSKIE